MATAENTHQEGLAQLAHHNLQTAWERHHTAMAAIQAGSIAIGLIAAVPIHAQAENVPSIERTISDTDPALAHLLGQAVTAKTVRPEAIPTKVPQPHLAPQKHVVEKPDPVVMAPAPTKLTPPPKPIVKGTGFDISWPQCAVDPSTKEYTSHVSPTLKSKLPKADFAIVGLNYGNPNTVNPCLVAELRLAQEFAGDNVSVYVNTANADKYAKRAELDGRKAALFDLELINSVTAKLKRRLQPLIWNDVERGLGIVWQPNTIAGHASNVAMLRGMVETFKGSGYENGTYTAKDEDAHPLKLDMWKPIMGHVPANSILNGPEWIAAPGSDGCAKKPFIEHSHVALRQNVIHNLDINRACK